MDEERVAEDRRHHPVLEVLPQPAVCGPRGEREVIRAVVVEDSLHLLHRLWEGGAGVRTVHGRHNSPCSDMMDCVLHHVLHHVLHRGQP